MKTRRKTLICAGLILIACLAFLWLRRPASVEQARKETDDAVAKLEQIVKSQDTIVERIVTGARKEVAERDAKIRKDVSALSSDAVAVELMALLDEYRRERNGGN